MKTLKYNITINASKEKVWDILWNPKTYKDWTQYFTPDSSMETDWKTGGITKFLDASKATGMFSTIAELQENSFVSFKHLGTIENGVVDIESDDVKSWAGARENYKLTESGSNTKLEIESETLEDYVNIMDKGFSKGLEIIKKLSEQ